MADLPEATSRQDIYLKYIAENGSFSGGGGSDIPLPVSIANGGTGATTETDARTNLDVYSKQEVDDKIQSGGGVNVVQTTGTSETDVMSQKAVTDNLNLKVDKVDGKQLSTEDYTTEEKTKLSGIESEANKTVIVQTTGESTTDVMSQKATTDSLNKTVYNSPTMESGIDLNTKTTAGFYMVDSTSTNTPTYDSDYSLIVSTIGDTSQSDYPVFQMCIPTKTREDTSGSKNPTMYIRQKYLNVDTWQWTYWLNTSVLVQNSTGDSYEDTMSQYAITNNFLSKNIDKISIGETSKASGTGGISIGQSAESYQTGGISIGQYAFCPVPNSIALGANSQATEPNVLSVGNMDESRRIINVTDPTEPQDVATKNYVDPIVLYENSSGTYGTITIPDKYKNYECIKVYYYGFYTYGSAEFRPSVSSKVNLPICSIGLAVTDEEYVISSCSIMFSGTTAEFEGNRRITFKSTGGFTPLATEGQGIRVYKIVGYKY